MNKKTSIWQMKAHEQWVKTVLISDIIEPNSSVCEIFCGKGLDIGKWARAKIGNYVGLDSNELLLKEAQERWSQKKEPFPGKFLCFDILKDNIEKVIPKGEVFDNVCCFNGIQYCSDKEKMNILLENIVSVLKTGGYFFGILPDSSAIWYKAQKVILGRTDKALMIKGDLYTVHFPREEFDYFGTQYVMRMEGYTEQQQEYLIHFPSFVRAAESVGLNMLEITNLIDFYEDHKKNYAELLKSLGVLTKQGKIEPQQKDLIGLHTTFCFQKVDKGNFQ